MNKEELKKKLTELESVENKINRYESMLNHIKDTEPSFVMYGVDGTLHAWFQYQIEEEMPFIKLKVSTRLTDDLKELKSTAAGLRNDLGVTE